MNRKTGSKQSRRIILGVIALVIVIGIVAAVYASTNSVIAATTTLETSGTIEAKQVALVVEVGGQISDLPVREGSTVKAGTVLAQLDPAFLDAQIVRAQAGLAAAKANLAQVQAGKRAEEIAQARAALERASAARDGAQQALKNLQALRDNPQELDAQIAETRAQLKAAQANVTQAENQIKAAQVAQTRYQGATSPEDRVQLQAANAQVDIAQAGLQAAQAGRDGAQTALDLLLALRKNPIQLNTQIHAAEAGLAQASAAVELAQAYLDGMTASATKEQIAIADSQVQQAQAVLEQLQAQLEKMTFRAPINGVVTALPVHIGENVQPGSKVATLADLDTVDLRVYVPEPEIGHVKVGQRVTVRVDSLPGQTLEGRVTFIALQPEFTPNGTQTQAERTKTVFMVKVRIANSDHALKPGMPADAVIQTD